MTVATMIELRMLQMDASIEEARTEVKEYAKRLIERLESAIKNVEEGHPVNRLGVVQGMALDVDISCAVLAERLKAKAVVEGVWELVKDATE